MLWENQALEIKVKLTKYDVMVVPTIIVDEELKFTGVLKLEELLEKRKQKHIY